MVSRLVSWRWTGPNVKLLLMVAMLKVGFSSSMNFQAACSANFCHVFFFLVID